MLSGSNTESPDDEGFTERVFLRQTSYGEVVPPPIPPSLDPEKHELQRALQVSLDENRELKAEVTRLQALLQGKLSNQTYTVTPDVLVISGSWGLHKVERVPLVKILEDTAQRVDKREGDTPMGVNPAHDFAVDSSPMPSSADPSPLTPTTVEPSSLAISQKSQPGTLKIPVRVSNSDAVLTLATLKTFHRMWADAASPSAPAAAESVKFYIVSSFMAEFQHDPQNVEKFGRAILHLCSILEPMLRDKPLHVEVPSPCYVFGDIHGNIEDLVKFCSNLINFWD
eukprot:PhF_6_TR30943/c0_g1_i1/m.45464